jgi:hypothetical protein
VFRCVEEDTHIQCMALLRSPLTAVLPYAMLVLALASGGEASAQGATGPRHFVYFGRDRERIQDTTFANDPAIAGAQLRYTWKELEPERDRYDLGAIREDIARLQRHGKRLFIQVQDVSFNENVLVPDYLRLDPTFNGGAERKFEAGPGDTTPPRFDGWVARRWDPAVRTRFIKLLEAIAAGVDGQIEGINLAEAAIGFEIPRLHPAGFSFDGYAASIREVMLGARRAFRRSHVIQYVNFMPGDWSEAGDRRYIRSIYAYADSIGAGVGGPDLLPHRRPQRRNSLPLIAARARGTVAGVAVQDGNLADVNPATGRKVTAGELYRYATDTLRLDYIFWGTEEPYYSNEVLPLLHTLSPRSVPSRPAP